MSAISSTLEESFPAFEMLENEPDLKALLERRSNYNGAINASTKFLKFILPYIDSSKFTKETLKEFQTLFNEVSKFNIRLGVIVYNEQTGNYDPSPNTTAT